MRWPCGTSQWVPAMRGRYRSGIPGARSAHVPLLQDLLQRAVALHFPDRAVELLERRRVALRTMKQTCPFTTLWYSGTSRMRLTPCSI